jgi:hypothetical protein
MVHGDGDASVPMVSSFQKGLGRYIDAIIAVHLS